VRLFVAIETSIEVRRALGKVQRSLAAFDDTVRWTAAEQLHMTLKFLGDVEDGRLPSVVEVCRKAASATQPFAMRFVGCGCFPPSGRVRIVWAGTQAPAGTLDRCQLAAEDAFAEMGFPPEGRAFAPHLTIGRVREDRTDGRLREAVAAAKLPPVEQLVEEIVLMQSVLRAQGAEYVAAARIPLGS